jgi:hypothetical protein
LLRNIQKWLHLPKSDRSLFLQVFCLTGLVRAAVLVLPFRWIAVFLGEQGVESSYQLGSLEKEAGRKIGRAILRVSRHTPWESKCLVQAITGKILLRRRGINNTLYLGVNKESKGKMTAHAWLRAGDMIITGNMGRKGSFSLSWFGEEQTLKRLTPELILLFESARGADEPEQCKERIELLLFQPINWDLFLQLALKHRVFPVVYKTLHNLKIQSVPSYIMNHLKQEYEKNAFKSLVQTGEMIRLIRLFQEQGISSLVLKGVPLAEKLYQDITLRMSKDIDILVPLENLARAEKILQAAGYEKKISGISLTPRQSKACFNKYHPENK